MTPPPALRRKPAYRDLRIAANIGSLSFSLSYPRHTVVQDTISISTECLTFGTDLADLIPQPLFHGRPSAHRGSRVDSVCETAAESSKQALVDRDGLGPFPEFDEAHDDWLLLGACRAKPKLGASDSSGHAHNRADTSQTTPNLSQPKRVEPRSSRTHAPRTPLSDVSATQQAHRAVAISGPEGSNSGASSAPSAAETVHGTDSVYDDQPEMLRTLHGFPYDFRKCRSTSHKPERVFRKGCVRAVKGWVRRLMRR
ncbi:hypothetical protein B0A55_07279 [Friedmanniomyces simplex]|uniref:Uncharacterized protein n=1 Tax=Friedmanniomyces simplex TaxID=329884 RepID=A0A4U0X577_9PEZI|nr:hypothetical protein B0A55_07279 [Friedmanniomyces simplex]